MQGYGVANIPVFLHGRLDFCWWILAWDRYALAAAATQQMPFEVAMRHKAKIVGMAANAVTEGKSTQLAVIYDDLVRSGVVFK